MSFFSSLSFFFSYHLLENHVGLSKLKGIMLFFFFKFDPYSFDDNFFFNTS